MDQAKKLRDLAAWYRKFAEHAGSPTIWDARRERKMQRFKR
jgi:hypothetical protein